MPPTPLATITATQTAAFKLRSPSAWKRAVILDAMKRTHLATEAAVGALLEHFEEYRAIPKKGERMGAMQQLAY